MFSYRGNLHSEKISKKNKKKKTSLQAIPVLICSNEAPGRRIYNATLFRYLFKRYQSGCSGKKYRCSGNAGSATVEASLVLPIFLMAMLFIFSVGKCICVKGTVYEAFQEAAQYMAETQYLCDVTGKTAQTVTANLKIRDSVDDKRLVEDFVSGGIKGLVLDSFSYHAEEQCIYMALSYGITINIPFFGTYELVQNEQIKQRAYVGKNSAQKQSEDRYVYVTENPSVYHDTRDCYHIRLSVSEIQADHLKALYASLEPCEFCAVGKRYRGHIFITQTGNRYHFSLSCSGLKRTVYRKKLKDVGGLPPCSACGSK